MSSKKRKTRFQLTVNGKPKELFAIRERSEHQLAILSPRPRNFEWEGNKAIREEHISVHGSDKRGSNCLVKRTTLLDSGDLIEDAQLMLSRDNGWATVIYGKASQDLSDERYDLLGSPKDTIIDVGSHDSRTSTFVFSVIVADKPWDISRLAGLGPNFRHVQLKRFGFGIVFAYQNVPSSPLGQYSYLSTSLTRVNYGEVFNLRRGY